MKKTSSIFIFWIVIILIILSGIKGYMIYNHASSVADQEVDFSKYPVKK